MSARQVIGQVLFKFVVSTSFAQIQAGFWWNRQSLCDEQDGKLGQARVCENRPEAVVSPFRPVFSATCVRAGRGLRVETENPDFRKSRFSTVRLRRVGKQS